MVALVSFVTGTSASSIQTVMMFSTIDAAEVIRQPQYSLRRTVVICLRSK